MLKLIHDQSGAGAGGEGGEPCRASRSGSGCVRPHEPCLQEEMLACRSRGCPSAPVQRAPQKRPGLGQRWVGRSFLGSARRCLRSLVLACPSWGTWPLGSRMPGGWERVGVTGGSLAPELQGDNASLRDRVVAMDPLIFNWEAAGSAGFHCFCQGCREQVGKRMRKSPLKRKGGGVCQGAGGCFSIAPLSYPCWKSLLAPDRYPLSAGSWSPPCCQKGRFGAGGRGVWVGWG